MLIKSLKTTNTTYFRFPLLYKYDLLIKIMIAVKPVVMNGTFVKISLMENTSNDLSQPNNHKTALTPRQLVNRRIANPDEPITEEDIKNMDLSIHFTSDEQHEIEVLADEYSKEEDSSYNALQN